MNRLHPNRSRWRKKNQRISFYLSTSLLLLIFVFLSLLFYTDIRKSLPSSSRNPPPTPFYQCSRGRESLRLLPEGERFLWYAPHSGFSNQLSELKNAILFAAILNRTLIVPPVLDHHAVALGSCPKFRVSTPSELRKSVWDHITQLVQTRQYVSMADIVDLSSVLSSSLVRAIDFRVFASLLCGLKMDSTCFGSLCCAISGLSSLSGDFKTCGSLLSGQGSNVSLCSYAVEKDCRTTVWTYQQNNDGLLDSFQPDKQLKRKKKIPYVRRHRDVYKAFGNGSEAEAAMVLSFGSLFTAPYKGSELYIDIHEAPKDPQIQMLLQKTESLQFVPEILDAGKEFAVKRIKVPFLCAQLRLLDGQFKNHWNATFLALQLKIQLLREAENRKANNPINIFVMTDLPASNWSGTLLGELARDSDTYKLHHLQGDDEMVALTAQKVMAAEHGLRSGFLPMAVDGKSMGSCPPVALPDVLLYIEQVVCSCASLGFVGTAGSTIADSIGLMRKNNICFNPR